MILFKLSSESALFASDLKYKLCEESFYKNDPGSKSEDTLIILN